MESPDFALWGLYMPMRCSPASYDRNLQLVTITHLTNLFAVGLRFSRELEGRLGRTEQCQASNFFFSRIKY
jgi:hypothetical protein